ncbi:ArsR/SmtB family transcription factor [Paenibacillus sp. 481]|uniref:ArsR/SmtB family transcription factor n=1 Tax=Paenibacillus sp. 481 TaxID=2835869 RepID=UPI001E605038|nr:metalloregulator ArsR/SmtB family transcription factor [Paenibacillus sp. 481]UHA75132.1 winged helix-turn-helix transcriptional regulator [Paenibacillus sp. 481]
MTDIYRALGDPTRRTILHLLARGDKTQTEIVQSFSISQPAVKKHLQILLDEGLIREQKQGKYRLYCLERTLVQTAYQSLLDDLGYILEDQLSNLKVYLERGETKHE